MAEFKHPINMRICELQTEILKMTSQFDIIEIDVHSLLDAHDITTKPCSWQYWMNSYLFLVDDLVKAGIINEPKDSNLWNEWKKKEVNNGGTT